MAASTRKVKICRSSKFSLLLIVALIMIMSIMFGRMNDQLAQARSTQAGYAKQLALLQEKNAQLAEDIANSGDEELISDIARNDFGLASQGEKVFRFRN